MHFNCLQCNVLTGHVFLLDCCFLIPVPSTAATATAAAAAAATATAATATVAAATAAAAAATAAAATGAATAGLRVGPYRPRLVLGRRCYQHGQSVRLRWHIHLQLLLFLLLLCPREVMFLG